MRGTRDLVVVCGAGAAGMAAALAAARQGRPVALIEACPEIGGTVADCLIHTLGGLYDSAGELINNGLPGELVARLHRNDPTVRRRRMGRRTWVLSVCPETYRSTVCEWIGSEAAIAVHRGTRVLGAVQSGGRVTEIHAAGPGGSVRFHPAAVIDATGTAAVVRRIAGGLLQDETRRAAGGLIFTLEGVTPGTLAFPQGVGVVRALRRAAAEGALPAECGYAWLDTGVRDEVYVKLFVPLADGWYDGFDEITRRTRQTQEAVVAFLRRLPGFAAAVVGRTGVLGVRDGGRIRGEYCLSGTDVRAGRRFADAACRGCWPIEYWDPVQGVSVEDLPDGHSYDIPLRSLKVQGLQNVWAAGKCLSADREAQASARVAGTCWAMGEAAGRAAAEGTGNGHGEESRTGF